MRRWALCIVIAIALAGCGSKTIKVYITADSSAAGAQVVVDGRFVGRMSKERFLGRPAHDANIKQGELYGSMDLDLERGVHRLCFINERRDSVCDTLTATSNTYWSASFLSDSLSAHPKVR